MASFHLSYIVYIIPPIVLLHPLFHPFQTMFSFKIGPGALVLLSVVLPAVLADNLFAGCYIALPSNSNPPPTGSVLRASSLDCSVCLSQTRVYHTFPRAPANRSGRMYSQHSLVLQRHLPAMFLFKRYTLPTEPCTWKRKRMWFSIRQP